MASIAACSSSGNNISKREEKPDSKFDLKGLFDGNRAGEITTAYDKGSGTVYAVTADGNAPSLSIKGKDIWGNCKDKTYMMSFQPAFQINSSVKAGLLAEVKRAGAKITGFAESKVKISSSVPGFFYYRITDLLW